MEEIKGFEQYCIDQKGNVYNKKRNKKIKTTVRRDGYEVCVLRKNKKQKGVYIHRLMAIQFIENANTSLQVNHINGIKSDNRIENLEWVTAKQNTSHAIETGLKSFKIESYKKAAIKKRVVSIEQEEVIRSMSYQGVSFRKIGRMLNLHHKTISGIVNQSGDFRARPDNRNKCWPKC